MLTVDGGATTSRRVGGETASHAGGVGLGRDESGSTSHEEDGAELHSVLMLPGWWVESGRSELQFNKRTSGELGQKEKKLGDRI